MTTSTIPVHITEPELSAWLTEACGPIISDDDQAARLLIASFDLAAKEGNSLNNPHGIAASIGSTPRDGWEKTPWSPVDTARAATVLHDAYWITRKPADHARLFVDLPTPVVVSRHQCPFCRRFTRASLAQVQDHMTRCWQNPVLRCCKSCVHHQDGSGFEDDESCTNPDGPEPEDYRFPVLHCPLYAPAR